MPNPALDIPDDLPGRFLEPADGRGHPCAAMHEKRGESDPPDYSDNLLVQLGVATEPLNRRNVGGQPPARTRR
jgi:hypothetical protein